HADNDRDINDRGQSLVRRVRIVGVNVQGFLVPAGEAADLELRAARAFLSGLIDGLVEAGLEAGASALQTGYAHGLASLVGEGEVVLYLLVLRFRIEFQWILVKRQLRPKHCRKAQRTGHNEHAHQSK